MRRLLLSLLVCAGCGTAIRGQTRDDTTAQVIDAGEPTTRADGGDAVGAPGADAARDGDAPDANVTPSPDTTPDATAPANGWGASVIGGSAVDASRVIAHPSIARRLLVVARFPSAAGEVALAGEWSNGALGPLLEAPLTTTSVGASVVEAAYTGPGVPTIVMTDGGTTSLARFQSGVWSVAPLGSSAARPVWAPSMSWPPPRFTFSHGPTDRVLGYDASRAVDLTAADVGSVPSFGVPPELAFKVVSAHFTGDAQHIFVRTESPFQLRRCELVSPLACEASALSLPSGSYATRVAVHPAGQTVFVVGKAASGTETLYRSTGGGALAEAAWPTALPSTIRAFAMRANDPNLLAVRVQVSGGSELYVSKDGAMSWSPIPAPTSLQYVSTFDELAIDANGTLFFPRSMSGGGPAILYERPL